MYQLLNQLEHIGIYSSKKCRSCFVDPLVKNLTSLKHFHNLLVSCAGIFQIEYDLLINHTIQRPNSILRGLICIYIDHYFFGKKR